jgi:hypothetical protein
MIGYTLYVNKEKGIIEINNNINLDIEQFEITTNLKKYNDWYYYCKNLVPLRKKASEVKSKWLKEISKIMIKDNIKMIAI